jgi:hemolysin III
MSMRLIRHSTQQGRVRAETQPELENSSVSLPEERANALTHGLGLLLSLAGIPGLIAMAARHGDAWHVVSCSVYGATLIVLYAASTLYHLALEPGRKRLFRVVDHACIYLLIAGTYTPFTLVTLRGGWGWTLFGLVWGLAALGICVKVFWRGRCEIASTVAYILMGWLAMVAVKPMLAQFPVGCFAWVLAGGITYTVGTVFYALDRRPYLHAIWHVFVLAGSACHYVAVMRYVLPSQAWV